MFIFSQIVLAILASGIAFVTLYFFTEQLPQEIRSFLGGSLLGLVVSQIFAYDKFVIRKMTEDSRPATVLLLEYYAYCKQANSANLAMMIDEILKEHRLPPKLLLELHIYKSKLPPPITDAHQGATNPNSTTAPIPLPDNVLAELKVISGIACEAWERTRSI